MFKGLSVAVSAALLCAAGSVLAQQNTMTFFVTSAGPGKGADLGGLAGADRLCQSLAQGAGAGSHTWRAYLSTAAADGKPAVNARDRIGKGPWRNAKGVVVAKNVDDLHGTNNLTKETALNERGAVVNGRGDNPNMHDMLTGSQQDGRAIAGDKDMTCGNGTSSSQGSAMLGHTDRTGGANRSWNSAHMSRSCSVPDLNATGGNGLIYCFAAQ